jgi:hypothetical protein
MTCPDGLFSSSVTVVSESICTSFVAGAPLVSFVGTSTSVYIRRRMESVTLSPPLCVPRRSAMPIM